VIYLTKMPSVQYIVFLRLGIDGTMHPTLG